MDVPLMTQELVVTNEAVVSTVPAANNIASKLLGPEAMSLVMACQFSPAPEDLTALWRFAMVFLVLCEMCLEMFLPSSRIPNITLISTARETIIPYTASPTAQLQTLLHEA